MYLLWESFCELSKSTPRVNDFMHLSLIALNMIILFVFIYDYLINGCGPVHHRAWHMWISFYTAIKWMTIKCVVYSLFKFLMYNFEAHNDFLGRFSDVSG